MNLGNFTQAGYNEVSDYLGSLLNSWRTARQGMEEDWIDAWANFISSPSAYEWLERNGLSKFIKSNDADDCNKVQWKHKVHTGKGFEIAEFLWAYLLHATFSNEQWFTVQAHEAEQVEHANVIRLILSKELDMADFKLAYDDWLRHLIVSGTSAMRIDWCNQKQMLKFEPISNFRLYLQPNVPAHKADLFVVHFTNRRSLKRMIGVYNMLDEATLLALGSPNAGTEESEMDEIRAFTGVDRIDDWAPKGSDKITLYEYYGDVYEGMDYLGTCKVVFDGKHILHFEKAHYCPIVVATFINLIEQSWGISPTTASAGLLAADRKFLNSRLDNLESSSQDAYTYTQDGVVDEDWEVFPGAKIRVLSQDAIQPLQRGNTTLALTYQEEAALDSRINRNVGTIPAVGGASMRQAERVTAQEVLASKQAGGVRLNQYHISIERKATNKMLQLAYTVLSKYGTKRRKAVYDSELGEVTAAYTPKETCCIEVQFKIAGSEAILAQDSELTRTLEYAQTAAQIPQAAEKVDWDYILKRMGELWGLKSPEKLLKQITANADVTDEMSSSTQNALDANMAVDGGATLAQQAYENMKLQ
jgi:hypothetical protein